MQLRGGMGQSHVEMSPSPLSNDLTSPLPPSLQVGDTRPNTNCPLSLCPLALLERLVDQMGPLVDLPDGKTCQICPHIWELLASGSGAGCTFGQHLHRLQPCEMRSTAKACMKLRLLPPFGGGLSIYETFRDQCKGPTIRDRTPV